MQLNAVFDHESSKISDKIIFSSDDIELTRKDIAELKEKKLINYVLEETLPEVIHCQVLIFVEPPLKAKVMLFNNDFILPQEAEDEPFLNKVLLEQCKAHGWFWMEFMMPLYDKSIKIDFTFDTFHPGEKVN